MTKPRMLIRSPDLRTAGDLTEVTADVEIHGVNHTLWFRVPGDIPVDSRLDPFVISLLTSAMNLGADLVVEGELSSVLAEALSRYQTIFRTWFPSLQIADITGYTPVGDAVLPQHRGIASFFSGGVDSFHTALRNRDRVTDLILVHGFDFALGKRELRQSIHVSLQRAADRMGKRLIEVETNSRELTEPYASWPQHQYGNALIGVGHLLAGRIARILVPSSDSYAFLIPWGSHPLTDPLLRSERLVVEHDGADFSRREKVGYLADYAVALDHLRVCWRNPGDAYNCGVCEKCIRTRLSLLAYGVLDRCPTFPEHLTAEQVATVTIPGEFGVYHEDNLNALRTSGARQDIIDALAGVIDRYHQQRLGARLSTIPHLDPGVPEMREAVYRHDQDLLRILLGRGHGHLLRLWLKHILRGMPRLLPFAPMGTHSEHDRSDK